jgi:transcriptional regulator with XRE-family HTH domain
MWFDDMDLGGRGVCQPAKGPLGRAIRGLRHDLVISQERLGALVGVSQTAVSKLERGGGSWSLFCRLVEAAGGRPVVTIERIPTQRELFAAYMNDDDFDFERMDLPESDEDGW